MITRRILSVLVGGLCLSTTAYATTITVDGVQKTLGNFTIDQSGNISLTTSTTPVDPAVMFALTVNPTSNGSILVNGVAPVGSYASGSILTITAVASQGYEQLAWTDACANAAAKSACTLTMDAAKTVGATFTASTTPTDPPVDSACGATPTNVIVKDLAWTGNTGNSILETITKGYINAYRITPSTTRLGDFGAAYTGGAKADKALVVSACPGAMDKPIALAYCSAQGFEYAGIQYSAHAAGTTSRYYCNLEIGKTYYINVKNAPLNNLSGESCTSSSCSYYYRFR